MLLVVGEILGRGGSFDNEKIGFWSVDPREEVDIEDEDEDEDEDDEEEDGNGGDPVYSGNVSSHSNFR